MQDDSGAPKSKIVIFIIVGFAGFTFGAYLLWDILDFASVAEEGEGKILSRNASSFVIQYSVNGQTFAITEALPSTKGMSGLERSRLQPGTTVAIFYEPQSPGTARWNAQRNWIFPLCVIAVSVLCGFVGFFPDRARRPFGSRNAMAR